MPDNLKLIQESDLKTEPVNPAQCPGQIYRRILVGTDFSPASTPAFEQALKLARQNGAELLIAHCYTMPGNISLMPSEACIAWEQRCRKEGEKSIGALVQKAHKEGVKAHALLLTGLADDSIVEAAKRLDVDLIVIGTHGRRGVSKILLGSLAARVVPLAPCAVLTVRCA